MSKEKPLQEVPKGVKYLRVFCHGCDTLTGNLCRKTLLPISTCEHGEKQRYKIIKYEGAVRRTTTLETRNLNTAIAIASGGKKIEQEKTVPSVSNTPHTLVDWLARYTGHLHNDKEIKSIYSPDHDYSRKHLLDIDRYQKYLIYSLKEQGIDVESMRVEDIGEAEIRHFQNYVLNKLKLSEVSHDKAIRLMSSFMNSIKKMGYTGRNVFEGIPRKARSKEVEILTAEEIQGVLANIDDSNPKNHIHPNGRSMQKDWNRQAILLGALTGRRNEEVAVFSWKNLVFDEEQNPLYLKSVDLKVSRKKGIEKTNPKPIYIPVIPELKNLLEEMGLEKYKGKDKYILAPEETITRDTVKLHLSRMFSFYYDKLETGREMNYKHLRKFYISHLAQKIGSENARLVSGHSGIGVMDASYLEKRALAVNENTRNMTLLSRQTDTRLNELKSVRKQPVEKSIER